VVGRFSGQSPISCSRVLNMQCRAQVIYIKNTYAEIQIDEVTRVVRKDNKKKPTMICVAWQARSMILKSSPSFHGTAD